MQDRYDRFATDEEFHKWQEQEVRRGEWRYRLFVLSILVSAIAGVALAWAYKTIFR